MTRFTDDQLTIYQRDGFFLARGLFSRDEIDKLRHFAEQDPSFAASLYGRKDATG
ncbi:MAG: phytanoyl-CoA dioxygenase family protein, partial [Planctomycetia bacterium]|nr:phytanoyl-CoA dioxygenase family protein [Planctomycetia bacterium]